MTPARAGRFHLATLLTALVAVLAYCAADLRPGLALLALLAGVFSAVLMSPRRSAASRAALPRSLPAIAINVLVIAAAGHLILQLMTTTQAPITYLADFLVHVTLIKMLNRGRLRDETQLLGLSVFVILGAVLTSNSLLLGAALLAYTPMAIACAVFLQVHLGTQRQRELQGQTDFGAWTTASTLTGAGRRQLGAVTLLGITASAAIGVGVFLVSPRTLTQQLFGAFGAVRLGAMADFHDQIKLGEAGLIQTSEEAVMDVVLYDAQGRAMTPATGFAGPLYLRGAVLEVYDPLTGLWQSRGEALGAGERRPDLARDAVPADSMLILDEPFSRATAATAIEQRITLRSVRTDQSALFSLWKPARIRPAQSGTLQRSTRDMTMQFRSTTRASRLTYTVIAAPQTGLALDGVTRLDRGAEAMERAPFLRGPLFDLANQVLEGAGVPRNPEERGSVENRQAVQSLIAELRSRCTYTLEMVAPRAGQDPIEMFLFDTRRGHCEYFAAALVGLCRAVGIPARIVTGYAGGEFNPIAGQFVVRRADAHAWVEASLRPGRWEVFDPTPPAELNVTRRADAGHGVVAALKQFYEALEFTWIGSVVTFDRSTTDRIDLAGFAQRNREHLRSFREWLVRTVDVVKRFAPALGTVGATATLAAIGLCLALAVFYTARLSLIWARQRLGHRARQRPVILGPDGHPLRFYEQMLADLAKAGAAKPEGRPPLMHARVVGEALGARAGALVSGLSRTYYAARFGAVRLDAEEVAGLKTQVAELRELLATRGR